jgi:hypothetical protein
MPTKTGKCINFGGCSKADARELISIANGEDFVCPDCGKALVTSAAPSGGTTGFLSGKKKLVLPVALGAGLIAIILIWTTTGSAPVIQSFTADPAQVSAGQTANLKWSVAHGTDVSIDGGIGPVDASGTIPVSPIQTTTYTLTAKQGGKAVSKTVTLQVMAAPVAIESFTATPESITRGGSVTLKWTVRNAQTTSLQPSQPGLGNLPLSGMLNVAPAQTTTYTLVAQSASGQVQQTVTVVVNEPTQSARLQPHRRSVGSVPPSSYRQPSPSPAPSSYPAPVPTPTPAGTPVPAPVRVASAPKGVFTATLLSPISTANSQKGDQFTAKVISPDEYQGAILTGVITELRQAHRGLLGGHKNAEIGFQFETLTFRGRSYPISAQVTQVTNVQGEKGVDDEGHVIGMKSSWRNAALSGGVGAGLGALIGHLSRKGAGKGALIGGGAGAVVGMTVMSKAPDVEFSPGSTFTLKVTNRQRGSKM